ncbi:hypothetical protein LOK46_13725 [Methylobacterium sp. NMS14P]|uniref:hypothetical protein n=1 Tax=Methylobacterium sp. NMS14P TaxID=2894310 RepID=UPI00235828DE|nr:hypothetical protein [Methylobacterium sp. NMS14P]WCS27835.1 hypothetical protein LOK46_13725 [Methylobacterium sp. NMS14P]
MARDYTDVPEGDPGDEEELARGLITRKQRGEQVDDDILILLDDLERVGLTQTEAYRALYAHRPSSRP